MYCQRSVKWTNASTFLLPFSFRVFLRWGKWLLRASSSSPFSLFPLVECLVIVLHPDWKNSQIYHARLVMCDFYGNWRCLLPLILLLERAPGELQRAVKKKTWRLGKSESKETSGEAFVAFNFIFQPGELTEQRWQQGSLSTGPDQRAVFLHTRRGWLTQYRRQGKGQVEPSASLGLEM